MTEPPHAPTPHWREALNRSGAVRLGAAAVGDLDALGQLAERTGADSAGVRLRSDAGLRALAGGDGTVGTVASAALGIAARPVRAILFDKTATTNWALDWHQDRTIAVRARCDVPGYANWTVKQGMVHVEPPFALLARMVTLRIHLDPVDAENAPLLVAPGSHLAGLVREDDIRPMVERLGTLECLADAGDIWVYSTPILHASRRAARPRRRGVLQIDYSADPLPEGLSWLGL